ncbi:nudix hydrolase 9 [Aristolochia californica]|uniref:nudix hydrolase 9 n=1 Tax=Aristolochia californica TaxID=171875 RepID=UPI0035D85D9A
MEKSQICATSGVCPQDFKLMLSCPSGLSKSQVAVKFSILYDRRPHPDNHWEESVSEIWNHRLKENSSLYNGLKFRYGGHLMHKKGSLDEDFHVCLQLGLTDYRTFVGTNLNPLWEKFLVSSEDESEMCRHMSMPLGNGAIVETSDGKILLLQRSQNVGEFPGHFVFPGGHSEPAEIGISDHQFDKNLATSDRLNESVSLEMFDGIVREVVEEIGIPATSLSEPLFIGISRRELNVRPTAFFFLKCNLNSLEIQQLYSNAQDSYESTQLYAVLRGELESMSSRMPGCHRGGFALYELMMESGRII